MDFLQNIGFQLAAQQKTSPLSFLPMLLIFGVLFAVLILPQRKQKKRQIEFMSSLDVGDKVITTGGIYGVINFMEGDVAHLMIDTDVVIKISRASLARKVEEQSSETTKIPSNPAKSK